MNFGREYFAQKDSKDIAQFLYAYVGSWQNYYQTSGLYDKIKQSYNLYYGNHFQAGSRSSGSSILQGGRSGELSLVSVNHYRNFLKHMLNMITSQKPVFDGKAMNSDPESLKQAELAGQIIPQIQKQTKTESKLYLTAESSLALAEGYLVCVWNRDKGKEFSSSYALDKDGQVILNEQGVPALKKIKEGDFDVKVIPRTDVFFDPSSQSFDEAQWVMWREKENKFDLAARHPDKSEDIINSPPVDDVADGNYVYARTFINEHSPMVYKYHFYHKKTDAMPEGAYMCFLTDNTILNEKAPSPYGESLPIFRMCPSEVIGTCLGYSDGFDLMPLQQVYDVLFSSAFTNNAAFGVQSILVPDTCNISADQISQNMVFLKYNPQGGKPEPLQLTATPAELYKLLELTEHLMEVVSGVNSVARGNPESSLKSGVALGLVQSMAIQFASGFQRQWVKLLEEVSSWQLKLFQKFATTERFVSLAGKDQATFMKAFKGSDFDKVDGFSVDLGNPLSQSIGGKLDMAQSLLQAGQLPTPEEFITVATTGRIQPALRKTDTMLHLIHQENDDLLKGINPPVYITDNDRLHLEEHDTILNDPEVRKNPKIIDAVLAHRSEHLNQWAIKAPVELALNNQPPMPMPMLPPMPGEPMPQDGAQPAPQPAPEGVSNVMQNPEAAPMPQPPLPDSANVPVFNQ